MKISKEKIDKIWQMFYLGIPSYLIAKELDLSEAEVISVLYPDK